MDDVDIALFERDWNNTLYYFLMNADEHIYMRYGGRDARGPMTYLNLDSLELVLSEGLERHRQLTKLRSVFSRLVRHIVENCYAAVELPTNSTHAAIA